MKLLVLLALAAGVFYANIANAQERSHGFDFLVTGEAGLRDYDKDRLFLERGAFVGASAIVPMTKSWAFEIGASYGRTEADMRAFEPCASCQSALTGTEVGVAEGRLNLLYLMHNESAVTPYVSGGVGGYSFSSDEEQFEGSAWALNIGGGVLLDAGPVALRVDGRYNPAKCDILDVEQSADIWQVGAGIAIPIGRADKPRKPAAVYTPPPAPDPRPCTDYPPDGLSSPLNKGSSWLYFGRVERDYRSLTIVGSHEGRDLLAERGDSSPYRALLMEDRCESGMYHRYTLEREVRGTTG